MLSHQGAQWGRLGPVSRMRVAAYVVRQRPSWELLVFEQVGTPEAGSQIPAGGIRPSETPGHAVLREVTEETGLDGLRLRTQLQTENKPHPVTGESRTTTFFVVDAPDETPDAWMHSVLGQDADAGMIFKCRFTTLPLLHPLADDQDAWLGLIDASFTTIARR